jgi:hypothetical protein
MYIVYFSLQKIAAFHPEISAASRGDVENISFAWGIQVADLQMLIGEQQLSNTIRY